MVRCVCMLCSAIQWNLSIMDKLVQLSTIEGLSTQEGQYVHCMYYIKGKVSWYIVACPLLRESIIRGFTVLVCSLWEHALALYVGGK